jgi:hypothetical protein
VKGSMACTAVDDSGNSHYGQAEASKSISTESVVPSAVTIDISISL